MCACSFTTVVSDSLLPNKLYLFRILCPRDSPGKNIGLLCLPPGDLPHLGIESRSPPLQADSLPLSHQRSPILSISSIQSLSSIGSFPNLWTAARQASLSMTSSQCFLKLMSIQSVMPYNHLFSVIHSSSCLQFFPASESFPMSQFFTSGDQSIGASASASVEDWFPLGLAGFVSGQSTGLLRIFSNTTVQKHQFFGAQLSLWSNYHIQTCCHCCCC